MSTVIYPHLDSNADGIPYLSGTTTKVVEIVQDHLAHVWDALEIRRQYPYLSLSQIHSALAYYYGNRDKIDRDIERRCHRVAAIRSRHSSAEIHDRLHESGQRP